MPHPHMNCICVLPKRVSIPEIVMWSLYEGIHTGRTKPLPYLVSVSSTQYLSKFLYYQPKCKSKPVLPDYRYPLTNAVYGPI